MSSKSAPHHLCRHILSVYQYSSCQVRRPWARVIQTPYEKSGVSLLSSLATPNSRQKTYLPVVGLFTGPELSSACATGYGITNPGASKPESSGTFTVTLSALLPEDRKPL